MLLTRIITAVIFGVAMTAALLFAPPFVAAAVLGALWVAGAWEWGGLANVGAPLRLVYTLVLAAAMALGVQRFSDDAARLVLIVALLWWLVALVLVVRFPQRFSPAFVAVAGIVTLWPSYVLLVRLHGNGAGLAFAVLLVVWAADVGAYAFGRLLGRTKLAPAVSPGKTWEGVTGGVVTAGLAAAAAAFHLGVPVAGLVTLGVATALVSVLGDL